MKTFFEKKGILITGVAGTIGSELVKQLGSFQCQSIIGIDNAETELFNKSVEFESYHNIEVKLCDIRSRNEVLKLMQNVDIVFHCAALKHVTMCEASPNEAINTNIVGTLNITECAEIAGVETCIFTSSDKAVNPTNVMGTSKLMGERIVTSMASEKNQTSFASTRFGNVLGSRGSVVPIFKKQILAGNPITLTHEDMTRFIMSKEHAAELVLRSALLADLGEVFVTKMPAVKIVDLARAMMRLLKREVPIDIIGIKPGEKLYEELNNDEETRRTYDNGEFLAIIPALNSDNKGKHELLTEFEYNSRIYNSSNCEYLSEVDICEYLIKYGII